MSFKFEFVCLIQFHLYNKYFIINQLSLLLFTFDFCNQKTYSCKGLCGCLAQLCELLLNLICETYTISQICDIEYPAGFVSSL